MEIKTLNEQIERLRELVRKCYGAVAGKNGTVPEVGERNMENLPAAIGSIKSASEVPKVKVSSLKVTNDCINEEGRWEGETLIDTSECVDINFRDCSSLSKLDTTSWDTSKVQNLNNTFYNCGMLQEIIGLEQWDLQNAHTIASFFTGTKIYGKLDLRNWKCRNIQYFSAFDRASNITEVDLRDWDTSRIVTVQSAFRYCGSAFKVLKINMLGWYAGSLLRGYSNFEIPIYCHTIIGDKTIDEVISNELYTLKDCKNSISFLNSGLDRPSLRAVINGLADVTDQPAESRPTLTLGATLMAKLTDEDRVIATEKGWNLA
jgi:surface protein